MGQHLEDAGGASKVLWIGIPHHTPQSSISEYPAKRIYIAEKEGGNPSPHVLVN
jgi:hypothetical protein